MDFAQADLSLDTRSRTLADEGKELSTPENGAVNGEVEDKDLPTDKESNSLDKDVDAHARFQEADDAEDSPKLERPRTRITFDPSTEQHPKNDGALYIPGPRDRERGMRLKFLIVYR